MEPTLELFLEGDRYPVYWWRRESRDDARTFFDSLPKKVQASLAGTVMTFAQTGMLPSAASGHPERWHHERLPPGSPKPLLFKFKDDPLIRFYSVIHTTDHEERVVITFGFKDPKKGREHDKHTPTGRITQKAERITAEYLLSLRPQ